MRTTYRHTPLRQPIHREPAQERDHENRNQYRDTLHGDAKRTKPSRAQKIAEPLETNAATRSSRGRPSRPRSTSQTSAPRRGELLWSPGAGTTQTPKVWTNVRQSGTRRPSIATKARLQHQIGNDKPIDGRRRSLQRPSLRARGLATRADAETKKRIQSNIP